MQDGEHAAWRAGLFQHIDGGFNFAQGCHAGGKDDLFSKLADMAQIGQIGDFTGGYLEPFLPQSHQQIDAFNIKTGGEKCDLAASTVGDEFMVHGFGQFQPLQHGVLRFAAIGGLCLVVGLFGAARYLAVGVKGLELDQIRTGGSGFINQALGHLHVAVVVDARFGNDEDVRLHDFS